MLRPQDEVIVVVTPFWLRKGMVSAFSSVVSRWGETLGRVRVLGVATP